MPRLAAAYQSHCSQAGPAADSSTVRTLQIVGCDLAADWREGEIILQSLILDDSSVRHAADTVARLEAAILPRPPRGVEPTRMTGAAQIGPSFTEFPQRPGLFPDRR